MADTIAFELVSPEKQLASREAASVTVPGQEGDLTAMPDHAPFLTTLRPGYVTVRGGGEEAQFFVTGGFVEITGSVVSVLAEQAIPAADVDEAVLKGHVEAAEKELEAAGEDRKQLALQRLNDLRALL